MTEREVNFEVVTSNQRLKEILDAQSGSAAYAIDTEFLQNKTYFARLALVQIGWLDFIALVDPFSVDGALLQGLFASDALAIAHAGSNDWPLLHEFVGTIPARVFDTEIAAQFLGLPSTSLQSLISHYFDIEVDKSEQVRDWTVRPLPEKALAYAATDVLHLFDLTSELSSDLEVRGLLSAAYEETAFQLASLGDTDPQTFWWRVKELQRAGDREKLVGQFLFNARDQIARDLNLPRNWVIAEEELAELAKRPPTTIAELAKRTNATKLEQQDVALLWETLASALAAPLEELWPADADVTQGPEGVVLSVAKLYVRYRAHQLNLSANFLASHRDLVKFFRNTPSRLDLEWRREVLTNDLALLRAGTGALQVTNGQLVLTRTAD